MTNTSDLLFVYGTLQPGFQNPYARYLHQRAQFIGDATLPGQLFDIDHYPGAMYQPGSASLIHGVVFNIGANKAAILKKLDHYEGTAGSNPEYVRAIVPVHLNNEDVACWTYLYNWPTVGKRVIETGKYSLV